MEETRKIDQAKIREIFAKKKVDYFFVDREKGEPQFVQMLDLDSIKSKSKSVIKKKSSSLNKFSSSSRGQSEPRMTKSGIELSKNVTNSPKNCIFKGFFSFLS
jgi:hypothetical protein